MKVQYANELIQNMGLGDPITGVHRFILDENEINDTKIIQFFIMHGLGLYIKLKSFVAHVLYVWSFSNNTAVPISINKNKYSPLESIQYCVFLGSSKFE